VKKLQSLLSLLLLFGFLSSTTGINVYKHYCGDFLAEVSFFVKSDPCADEGGEDACSAGKEMDCCEDQTEFYQLDTQLIKQSNKQEGIGLISVEIQLKNSIFSDLMVIEGEDEPDELPPPKYRNPLYKQFQRLLFYG